MPVGSPHLRSLLTGTRGTPLGQRGATRDKSPGTEVYIGSTITEFPNNTTVFYNLQRSTLAKNSNEKKKKIPMKCHTITS